jgi:hypothetical protein
MYSGMYPYSNEGFSDKGNKKEPSCTNVVGFKGLLCSPDNNYINPKDIYSEAKGSLGCKSYGYSNSKGFLCMDPEQVRLLTSRGGNA